MASSTVDQHLGEWLEAATVEISSEQHTQWRNAITAMSKALDSNLCLEVTAAAHGEVSDPGRAWMSERLREQDPGFSAIAKDFLLAIIAGAVIIETLETATHPRCALSSLLVESARCTSLIPQVPAVGTIAHQVGNEVRRKVRERAFAQKPILKEITDELNAVPKLDPAAGDWTITAGVLAAQGAALLKIAGRADETSKQLGAMLRLQDEELNTLWWSYGGQTSTSGVAWEKVAPVERRAVLAAVELRRLLTGTPSPPSSRALLARVLGGAATSPTTLAAVAEATVEFLDDVAGLPDHRLVPVASAARERRKMGGDDDTWKTVVSRTLGYDTGSEISMLDAAEQVLRELDTQALY